MIAAVLLLVISAAAAAAAAMIYLGDAQHLKAAITAAVKQTTGRALHIDGNASLQVGLSPTLRLEKVRFANAPWGTRPDLADIRSIRMRVALLPLILGRISFRSVTLIAPDILVETDDQGHSNLDFGDGKASSSRGLPGPELYFERIQITDAVISLKSGLFPDGPRRIRVDRGSALASSIDDPIQLDVDTRYQGVQVSVSGRVGSLRHLVSRTQPWAMDLRIQAGRDGASVNGAIRDVFQLQHLSLKYTMHLSPASPVISRLAPSWRLPDRLAISGTVKREGQGPFLLERNRLHMTHSQMTVNAAVTLSESRPVIHADVIAPMIDTRWLFPKASGVKRKSAPPSKKTKLFSTTPLPTGWRFPLSGDIRVRIDKLLLPLMAVENISAQVQVKNSRIDIAPAAGTIGGGRTTGQVGVRFNRHRLIVSGNLAARRVDAGTVMKQLGRSPSLEGRFDTDIRFHLNGASVAELMGNLDGYARVTMENGRIQNRLVGILGEDLSHGFFRMLNPGGESSRHTDINCMVARFDIHRGRADATVLVFDAPKMSGLGTGHIDLKTEALDIAIKPIPKKGIGAKGLGRISLSLSELAKPFKLGGTLAAPELVLNPGQSLLTIGKAVGGVALFGPLGILTALVGSNADQGNVCLEAIRKANLPPPAPSGKPKDGNSQTPPKGFFRGLGDRVKGWFDR